MASDLSRKEEHDRALAEMSAKADREAETAMKVTADGEVVPGTKRGRKKEREPEAREPAVTRHRETPEERVERKYRQEAEEAALRNPELLREREEHIQERLAEAAEAEPQAAQGDGGRAQAGGDRGRGASRVDQGQATGEGEPRADTESAGQLITAIDGA